MRDANFFFWLKDADLFIQNFAWTSTYSFGFFFFAETYSSGLIYVSGIF